MPNRFVHSRQSRPADAPYLTVTLGAKDKAPPAAPTELHGESGDQSAGTGWLSWVPPKDEGPAGTVGFFAHVGDKEVPRYLIPLAGKPDDRVRMRLRDLDLAPGATVPVAVRAVDGAGNVGPVAVTSMKVSPRLEWSLPGIPFAAPFTGAAPLPRLGAAEIAVVDELDKVQPVTGEMIPKQPNGYLAVNHLWSAKTKEIQLYAARNEFAGFQVLVHGTANGVRPSLIFDNDEGGRIKTTFGRYRNIPETDKGPLPDPVVPLGDGLDFPLVLRIGGGEGRVPRGAFVKA